MKKYTINEVGNSFMDGGACMHDKINMRFVELNIYNI